MKSQILTSLFAVFVCFTVSASAFAETKIICDVQQIVFTPDTGDISGNALDPDAINSKIKALESSGKKVKVTQTQVTYGGFQAVAAAVGSRFVNSKAVQYPTICATLEIN